MASADAGAAAAAAGAPTTGGAEGEEEEQLLTREQTQHMTDDEFFAAYQQGRVKRRADHLTEDNWEEQIEQIPLFMTKAPTQEVIDKTPLLAALQASIYEDGTPTEIATYHKTHANSFYKKGRAASAKNLKRSHFHKAIDLYTEGIAELQDGFRAVKEGKAADGAFDGKLLSILYSNRAAVNLELRNNGKVIKDCTAAIKINPGNVKAFFRGATACMNVSRYEDAKRFCEDGLVVKEEPLLAGIRTKAVAELARLRKRERLQKRQEKRLLAEEQSLMQAIQTRGVRWTPAPNGEIHVMKAQSKLTLNAQGKLCWPTVFLYPEHNQSDVILQANETSTLLDHLSVIFDGTSFAGWDAQHVYRHPDLAVYYEITPGNQAESRLVRMDPSKPIKALLQHREVVLQGLVLVFKVFVSGSECEKRLLSAYGTVMSTKPFCARP